MKIINFDEFLFSVTDCDDTTFTYSLYVDGS